MRRVALLSAAVVASALVPCLPQVVAASSDEGWVLPATDRAVTLIGNGYLKARVAPSLQFDLVGAKSGPAVLSTVDVSDDSGGASLSGIRQSLNLRTGTVITSALWTSKSGHTADLRYEVFADRARPHLAVTRLELTPHWSGLVRVTDPVRETVQGGVAVVSVLDTTGPTVPVSSGKPVAITKYLGVASALDAADPPATVRAQTATAARLGWSAVARENQTAWGQLWRADIEVRGDHRLQNQVRADEFAVLAGVRAGTAWTPSAAEWTYPTLLAQHPDIVNSARFERSTSPDAALSVWQYWLATGDQTWLHDKGFPILRAVADAVVSKAGAGVDVPARDSLRYAASAAGLVGETVNPQWTQVADGPRSAGSGLTAAYPWENDQPDSVTRADVRRDAPRTDATDSIRSVLASQLGDPGCAAFTYTRRGADSTTGVGGFLQEFLYGYSGLRWRSDRVRLDPTLPPQLRGITVTRLLWQNRAFAVDIGPEESTVRSLSGLPLPVEIRGSTTTVQPYGQLTVPTRRPDLAPGGDLARCAPVTADSADPLGPAIAAVDGDPLTAWQSTKSRSSVAVDLRGPHMVNVLSVRWGAKRPTAWTVAVSDDGLTWTTVARLEPNRTDVDLGRRAAFVQVSMIGLGAQLAELQVG